MTARTYDTTLGAFTSVDPLHGVNRTTTIAAAYPYAGNNPIANTDPTGESATDYNAFIWNGRYDYIPVQQAKQALRARAMQQQRAGEPISLPPVSFGYEACIQGLVYATASGPFINAVQTSYCVDVKAGNAIVGLKFNSSGYSFPGWPSFGLEDENGNKVEVDDKGASAVAAFLGSTTFKTTVTGSTECGCVGLTFGGSAQVTPDTTVSYTVTPGVVSPISTEFTMELTTQLDAGELGQITTKLTQKVENGDPYDSAPEGEPELIPEPEVQAALQRTAAVAAVGIAAVYIYFVFVAAR